MLTGDQAGKYVGVMNVSGIKGYFIKKFDKTPHIYHSWWSNGQAWDKVTPVSPDALGPSAQQVLSDRIETYVECELSIDDTDFKAYFEHAGNTQTAFINELGLVAFDIKSGDHSELESLYKTKIDPLLYMLFDKKPDPDNLVGIVQSIKDNAAMIYEDLSTRRILIGASHLTAFMTTMNNLSVAEIDTSSLDAIQTGLQPFRNDLCDANNIGVEALYNQNDELQYVTNNFMTYVNSEVSFTTEDEAERIRLITYYTFNSIPIEQNFELLINYRLYAN
jgi:hypothetical protein